MPSLPNAMQSITRRRFIQSHLAAALAARTFPAIIPASALGLEAGKPAPSNRITLGIIGCGPQGMGVLSGFLKQPDCQVVAACDVNKDRLQIATDKINTLYQNKDLKTYHDFRELVAGKDIDACLVATPDHWHVLAAIAAVNAGKDVYVEKPLGMGLDERQALRAALAKNKRLFQFGTQQRSSRNFRFACELTLNNLIGDLKHINIWAPGSAPGGATKVTPPPPGLDFDFWQGPARRREHTEDLCSDNGSTKTWWFVSNYALGFIAGWGIHPLDIALWGAGDRATGQVEIQGKGVFRPEQGISDTAIVWEVDFKFATGLTMKFVGVPNGGNHGKATGDAFAHGDEWMQRYRRIDSHGTAFEGADGWVHVDRNRINAQPQDLARLDSTSFKTRLIQSSSHQRNFLDSVKSREATIAPIDPAVAGDNLCHAADLACRLQRKLTFDTKYETFPNDAEANALFKGHAPHAPWKI